VGNSLKKLAELFNLPRKDDRLTPSEYLLDDLPTGVEEIPADYSCHHTFWLEQICLHLIEQNIVFVEYLQPPGINFYIFTSIKIHYRYAKTLYNQIAAFLVRFQNEPDCRH